MLDLFSGTVQLLCPHGGFYSKKTDKETLTCVMNRQEEISSKHKPGEFSVSFETLSGGALEIFFVEHVQGASLLIQWLSICLPVQGT